MREVTTRGPKKGAESIALSKLVRGQSFYTDKQDKDMTALAAHFGRKVRTERLAVLGGSKLEPTATPITKVTML